MNHMYQLKHFHREIIYAKFNQVDVEVPLVGTQIDAMLNRDALTIRFLVMEMMISAAIVTNFCLKLIPMGLGIRMNQQNHGKCHSECLTSVLGRARLKTESEAY